MQLPYNHDHNGPKISVEDPTNIISTMKSFGPVVLRKLLMSQPIRNNRNLCKEPQIYQLY